jgi:hypothetical protein
MRIFAYSSIIDIQVACVKKKFKRAVQEPTLLLGAELALLPAASGVASGYADIVLFSQLILTIWCSDGEGDCVVSVFSICMGRALLGAVAAVVEVPGPSGYVACRLIDEVNDGSSCA